MAINIISNTIDNTILQFQRPFTTHTFIELLITNNRAEWNNFVMSYRQEHRSIRVQEQIAVTQIGRYLGRNAKRLNIRQGRTIPDNRINGLIEHVPLQTTEWF
ncbi:MAG: hypothetical protein WBI06_14035 [Paludibacter sp.]